MHKHNIFSLKKQLVSQMSLEHLPDTLYGPREDRDCVGAVEEVRENIIHLS